MRLCPIERLFDLAARHAFRKHVQSVDLHKYLASVVHPYMEVRRIMLPWIYKDGAVEEANMTGMREG